MLDELGLIAPVLAVCGNTDAPGDPRLVAQMVCDVGGLLIHVSHGHEAGSPTPRWLLAHYVEPVLVYGHTHRPLITSSGPRLVINPGAAGPRRFNLRPTVARLTIRDGVAEAEIVKLRE